MCYRIFLFLCFFIVINQTTIAASFDCGKAGAPIEHAICDNDNLSDADSLLGKRYLALTKTLSESEFKTLRQEQRNWLKKRLKQCSVDDISCLENLYSSRIDKLETLLGINRVSNLSTQSVGQTVNDFILPGYDILDVTKGDLNQDKYTDFILILGQKNEREIEDALRPLLILTGNASNQLRLAARNDNIVLCAMCGGMFGDPYELTAIKNGYFTIEHYGGSSWRWTKDITFKYVAEKSSWYLHKITNQSYHASDPDNVEGGTQTAENFGAILFDDYYDSDL